MVSGALRVLGKNACSLPVYFHGYNMFISNSCHIISGKFMKTFTSTTSVESSLQAAADEVELNEDKLRRNKAT